MENENQKSAVIIGAGAAGLAAALELLDKSDIKPVILEATNQAGGLASTPFFNGNRTELFGQRIYFGSVDNRNWWQTVCESDQESDSDNNNTATKLVTGRQVSKIYHDGKLLSFPFKANTKTLGQLGARELLNSTLDRTTGKLSAKEKPENLEQFFIQQYGKTLYEKLFQPYAEKFWGTTCDQISPEIGIQRFEQFTASQAHSEFLGQSSKPGAESFWSPINDEGQVWTQLSNKIIERGGEIHYKYRVDEIDLDKNGINSVSCVNPETQDRYAIPADYCISTVPVKQLIQSLDIDLPEDVRTVSNRLPYRDLTTIGLLCDSADDSESDLVDNTETDQGIDLCFHVYDSKLKTCRLQKLYGRNNALKPGQCWVSLDYLCNDGEALCELSDTDLIELATSEAEIMGMIKPGQIVESLAIRTPKAYPVYSGSYNNFETLQQYLDGIGNLYLAGRNGLHQYNNIEHAIETAIDAVSGILKTKTELAD